MRSVALRPRLTVGLPLSQRHKMRLCNICIPLFWSAETFRVKNAWLPAREAELRRITLPRTRVNKGSLRRPLRLVGRLWTQPQRDVLGLHGVPDHLHHIVSQGIQVRLFAQPGAEGGKRLHGVVLASVEASVHEILYTPRKRVEQGGYCQRGSHNREGGPLTCEGAEDVLPADHPSEVDQGECGCQ